MFVLNKLYKNVITVFISQNLDFLTLIQGHLPVRCGKKDPQVNKNTRYDAVHFLWGVCVSILKTFWGCLGGSVG